MIAYRRVLFITAYGVVIGLSTYFKIKLNKYVIIILLIF